MKMYRYLPFLALAACKFIIPIPSKNLVVPAGPYSPGPAGHVALTRVDNPNPAYLADEYRWSDAYGTPRTASLIRNDVEDPFGSSGGYLREASYVLANGQVRRTHGTGESGWNGFGYVVNHFGGDVDNSKDKLGSYRVVFEGKHHAIHEFRLQMKPGGPVEVAVHWFFATGRSYPVYSITFDCTPSGDNTLRADSRAPYGDYAFDGTADAGGEVSGLGWGDTHLFRTTTAAPINMESGWDYTQLNRIPHVIQWSVPTNSEMGLVQTQTFEAHPAGGDYGGSTFLQCKGLTSATRGSQCSDTSETMPSEWMWPFQLSQYSFDNIHSKRVAWGMTYGSVGRNSVTTFGKTQNGYPYQSYAVHVVLDSYDRSPTQNMIAEMETTADSVVKATVGTVAPSGPGGIARTDEVGLSPSGFNHVYGAWTATMENNVSELDLRMPKGSVTNPVFQLLGYTRSTPPARVTWQSQVLSEDSGYFASVDAATQTLWITINGTMSGQNTLRVE